MAADESTPKTRPPCVAPVTALVADGQPSSRSACPSPLMSAARLTSPRVTQSLVVSKVMEREESNPAPLFPSKMYTLPQLRNEDGV